MVKVNLIEHWSPVRRTKLPDLFDPMYRRALEIAFIERLHDGGPYYAWVCGVRLGPCLTEQRAITAIQDWLKANWNNIELGTPNS